jgi:MFS family permease
MTVDAIEARGAAAPGSTWTARGAWWMLAVLIFFYLLNAFDRTILSLMVGHVKADFGVTDTQIGLLLGIGFALAYGVFGIPFGMLVDRMGRRAVLFGGVVLWSSGTIACAFAASFGHLLLARILLGIGEAALMPAAHSLMADRFPPRHLSTALSIFYLGGVFGNSLSVAVGGPAVAHFGRYEVINLLGLTSIRGWQMPFLLFGVLGIGMAFLCFTFREPPRGRAISETAKDRTISWGQILSRRRAVLTSIVGSFVLFSMVLYAVVLWTPTYMARAFGWDMTQIGLGYAIVHLGGAGAGTVLGGLLVDHLSVRGVRDAHLRVFAASVAIAAPAGILAFTVANPYVFLALEWVLFFFGFGYSGYAASMVQAVAPIGARGRMAGVYLFFLTIVGSGLGPSAIGFISDTLYPAHAQVGSSLILVLAVIAPISIAAALLGLRPMRDAVRENDQLERRNARLTPAA